MTKADAHAEIISSSSVSPVGGAEARTELIELADRPSLSIVEEAVHVIGDPSPVHLIGDAN